MYDDGRLYGVIQEGSHSFYLPRADGSLRLTSTADFFHFWQKSPGGWKLERAFSYDHVPTGDVPPQFLADFPIPVFADDSRLTALLAQHKIPSLAIADVRDGLLRQVRVVGELSAGRPAPVDAIYKVASLTKPITTMTTLRLVDAGLWKLDEPLAKYFVDPDLAGDPRLARLTTRTVLSHRSGLPNWRYLKPTRRLSFEFDPGERQQYSGEGFEILRRALEAHFGVGLEGLARQWLFEPAGMRDTHFYWSDAVDAERYAVPHDANGQPLAEQRYYQANAAANLLTTAGDYGRFLAFVARGAGLSPELRLAMMTPQGPTAPGVIPWGLGWQIIALPGGGSALQHTGGDDGIKALALIFPADRSATVLIENSENGLSIWKKYLEESFGAAGAAIVRANLGAPPAGE
jgi:CubicO group peptidase (beta-lactamase class C family)